MIPKDDLEAQTVTIAALGDIKVTKSKDEMISDAEAEKLAKKKKKSKIVKEKKLKKASLAERFIFALTDIMASPISRYTTIGASFRYFGQFASDYYLPLFYLSNYTSYKAEFALAYSMINLFCGFTSAMAGGIIADKFGKGRPMLKAWICVGGNMIALPLFVASVLTTNNFWLSMSFTALRFLFGEPWKSPSVTMI